jgi:phage shock protein PspC (stress-responsive transcriptional regulator)
MLMNRRLYRCRENRRLAGVAAGVAEYFDLDPTLVRVLWFLSIFVGGLGILLYIGLAIIVPLEPVPAEGAADVVHEPAGAAEAQGHAHARGGGSAWGGRATTFVGAVLILLGSLALVDAIVPGWAHSWRYLWPAFLVGVGVLLIVGAMRREPTDR